MKSLPFFLDWLFCRPWNFQLSIFNSQLISMLQISLHIMSFFYIAAGVYHFVKPKFYLYMMPAYIPAHKVMVWLSGVAEVVLGIGLLFDATRSFSAWGIILMLIAFFPVHISMLIEPRFDKISKTFRWARIPLQFLAIWWAYLFTV